MSKRLYKVELTGDHGTADVKGGGDPGMSDFGCVVHPKARKEYKCELCFGPIQTGENYVGYFGQWEGELQNWKMHAECYQSFSDNSPEDGFMPGEGEMPPYVKALVEDRLRSQAGKCWWQL